MKLYRSEILTDEQFGLLDGLFTYKSECDNEKRIGSHKYEFREYAENEGRSHTLAYVCAPYSQLTNNLDVPNNIKEALAVARTIAKDTINTGRIVTPIVPHVLWSTEHGDALEDIGYTNVMLHCLNLLDTDASALVVYLNNGITSGMLIEIMFALKLEIPIHPAIKYFDEDGNESIAIFSEYNGELNIHKLVNVLRVTPKTTEGESESVPALPGIEYYIPTNNNKYDKSQGIVERTRDFLLSKTGMYPDEERLAVAVSLLRELHDSLVHSGEKNDRATD